MSWLHAPILEVRAGLAIVGLVDKLIHLKLASILAWKWAYYQSNPPCPAMPDGLGVALWGCESVAITTHAPITYSMLSLLSILINSLTIIPPLYPAETLYLVVCSFLPLGVVDHVYLDSHRNRHVYIKIGVTSL